MDVTVDANGSKNRQAFYDIIVDVGYTLHNWSGRQFDTLTSARRFHSSRSVLSGLLAAGPNIVSNSEDAADGIYANVDMYLKSFFKGQASRTRTVLNAKELKEIPLLIQSQQYDRAFELCESLMSSSKLTVFAKAAYNCAVLLEFMERYNEVKYYLLESQKRANLFQAHVMLEDYRLYRAHK